jgi:hypothetical protein
LLRTDIAFFCEGAGALYPRLFGRGIDPDFLILGIDGIQVLW